ncbi:hypothetical protein TTHERM_00938910 (macronuclear) [Tetrahymena thermophila SB210]|uniref:Uncharacterized protein n=1 Tax=Tetrahymena thermophila (strain SB210) TaxID=312017 RepID=Q22DQ1_TETTS|nr:hypothetical protein TTHERM_00938910 [Tetrahymena thermophila SB210]EAR83403.2 hypothetical protein TTHERM_00938910 [Tetrahymena thermophila SB210]|eukprot:XP_001031066.2 hypothetical protein TTHERM_00938910 [Tetrahymena thermophila SB210]
MPGMMNMMPNMDMSMMNMMPSMGMMNMMPNMGMMNMMNMMPNMGMMNEMMLSPMMQMMTTQMMNMGMRKEEVNRRMMDMWTMMESQYSQAMKNCQVMMEQMRMNMMMCQNMRTECSKKMECTSDDMKKSSTEPRCDSVFRKTYMRTPDMEMEECWDSMDPKKCYTVFKKAGETPCMMPGMLTGNPMTTMMGTMGTDCCDKWEPMGEGMDEKFDRLCMMTGKRTKDMRDFVMQHKEMSVGQLFDKMCEMKMCN